MSDGSESGNGGWLTTTELTKQGISRYRANKYRPTLVSMGLARRTGTRTGPGSNPWLFSPLAVAYILEQSERTKRGPPYVKLNDVEREVMVTIWRDTKSISAVARAIERSWSTAKRLVEELEKEEV